MADEAGRALLEAEEFARGEVGDSAGNSDIGIGGDWWVADEVIAEQDKFCGTIDVEETVGNSWTG